MGVYTAEKKNGVSVYISYTPPGEERIRENFHFVEHGLAFNKRLAEVKREAEKELTKRRARIIEGRHRRLRPSRRVPTFAEYVETTYAPLLRRSAMKERPREEEVRRVQTGTVGRYFGAYRLDKITRSAVEGFVDERLKHGTGAAGINRDLARLRHLLYDLADREELAVDLPRIPWRRITRREEPESHRPMREDEELRLLAELRDPIVRAYVEVLLHTAIRPQAALQLRWRNVDMKRATITIARSINKTAEYVVYANTRVVEILRALYAQRPDSLRQPDALVFVHRNGKPRRSIRTAWEKACSAARVEGLHVRGLRATAATRLQEGGANTLDVAAHLGHSVRSLSVTARYVDPEEGHRRRIAELTIRHRPSNVVELRGHPRATASGASTSRAASGTL